MKSAMLVLMGLIFISANSAHAYNLKTSCKAVLLSAGDEIPLENESPVFASGGVGFGGSYAKILMGPYYLDAGLEMSQPFGSSSMQPTFTMTLSNGNPITGKINAARVQGLDLDARAVGLPLTVYGIEFLSFTYAGKNITRVDYNCSITKLP